MNRTANSKRIKQFRIGSRVQSHYRSSWYGTVKGFNSRGNGKETHQTLIVVVTHDAQGQRMRKEETKELDPAWVSLVPTKDDPMSKE